MCFNTLTRQVERDVHYVTIGFAGVQHADDHTDLPLLVLPLWNAVDAMSPRSQPYYRATHSEKSSVLKNSSSSMLK